MTLKRRLLTGTAFSVIWLATWIIIIRLAEHTWPTWPRALGFAIGVPIGLATAQLVRLAWRQTRKQPTPERKP